VEDDRHINALHGIGAYCPSVTSRQIDLLADCWMRSGQFKLKNSELSSFKIDVDPADGKTLVSRRYADGITFVEDQQTGQLKSANGLCIKARTGTLANTVICKIR